MWILCDANAKSGFIHPVNLNFWQFFKYLFVLNVEVFFQSDLLGEHSIIIHLQFVLGLLL